MADAALSSLTLSMVHYCESAPPLHTCLMSEYSQSLHASKPGMKGPEGKSLAVTVPCRPAACGHLITTQIYIIPFQKESIILSTRMSVTNHHFLWKGIWRETCMVCVIVLALEVGQPETSLPWAHGLRAADASMQRRQDLSDATILTMTSLVHPGIWPGGASGCHRAG